jgi:YD repeat-containing protein
MKQNSLKRRVLFVAFLLALFAYDSARGQLPSGVVARFYYDEQGRVIRQEKDTNGNGKIDLWIYYNKEGSVERVEKDVNFDGKPDIWIFYEGGKPKRQEVSSVVSHN